MVTVTYICPPSPVVHKATGLMYATVMQFIMSFGGAVEASVTLPDGSGMIFTIHDDSQE